MYSNLSLQDFKTIISLLSHVHAVSFELPYSSSWLTQHCAAIYIMLTSPSCTLRANTHQIRELTSVLVGNKWGRTRIKKVSWTYLLTIFVTWNDHFFPQIFVFCCIVNMEGIYSNYSVAISIAYQVDLQRQLFQSAFKIQWHFALKLLLGPPDSVSHYWKISPSTG